MKLRYFAISGQEKHLRDIRAMLHHQGDSCDPQAIAAWAERYGVGDAWRLVLSTRLP